MRSKTVTTMSKILATRLSSLVLIIALVLERVVTDSDVLKFYPIPDLSNYSLPSTSGPFNMPPGCICAKTGMTATTCDTFACDCSCDLTAAACDAECCCDPECPHGDFVFDESCYKEFENLKSKSTVKMCFDHHARLEQLNPAFPLRVSDTIEVRSNFSITLSTDYILVQTGATRKIICCRLGCYAKYSMCRI
jgi:hypothetical protein